MSGMLTLVVGCLKDADIGEGQPFCPPLVIDDPDIDNMDEDIYADFRLVNNMLERRCGELDCHGEEARPFRVFGQNSFRRRGGENLDPPYGPVDKSEYFPGGREATTIYELEGTFVSMCGLEPERMTRVRQGEPPELLSLIRKPRLQEKHKGGRLWKAGTKDTGDDCLLTWLQSDPGDVEDRRFLAREACIKELEAP